MSVATTAHLLAAWTKRDLRARYVQTVLGALWAIIQPIALTVGLVFVFGRVARIDVGMPYGSFVFPAMLLWALFSTAVTSATGAMAGSMYIASKARYPRIVAPVSGALIPLVDFTVSFALVPLLFAVQHPPWRFHPLPFVVALLGMLGLAMGLGILLSALNIFVRDVQRIVPLALQLLLLVTPIAYPSSRIPKWLAASPLATYIQGFRSSLLKVPGPTLSRWLIALATSALALLAGRSYFRAVEWRFADVA